MSIINLFDKKKKFYEEDGKKFVKEEGLWVGKIYSLLAFFSTIVIVALLIYIMSVTINWDNFKIPKEMSEFGIIMFFFIGVIIVLAPFEIAEITYNIWYMKKNNLPYGDRYQLKACDCELKREHCFNNIIWSNGGGWEIKSSGLFLCPTMRAKMKRVGSRDKIIK